MTQKPLFFTGSLCDMHQRPACAPNERVDCKCEWIAFERSKVVAPSEEVKQTHSSKLLHLALKIVADINQEFYENDYTNYLTLNTDGNCYEIEYLGTRLFLSEEDMRDEGETLYEHIWRKIDEVNNEPKKCPNKVLE